MKTQPTWQIAKALTHPTLETTFTHLKSESFHNRGGGVEKATLVPWQSISPPFILGELKIYFLRQQVNLVHTSTKEKKTKQSAS